MALEAKDVFLNRRDIYSFLKFFHVREVQIEQIQVITTF